MSVEITVKLSKRTFELLKEIAEDNRVTVEKLIEELIVEALIEHCYIIAEERKHGFDS